MSGVGWYCFATPTNQRLCLVSDRAGETRTCKRVGYLRLARSRVDRFAVVNTVEPRFKDTRLIRTLVNADNGLLSLVQSADSCRWSRQPCELCVVITLSFFKLYWTFRWQYVDVPSATSITQDMGWILDVNFRLFWHETRYTVHRFWIANALCIL